MPEKKDATSPEMHKRREEALRPCCVLGYDRDALGLHLLKVEAYRLAESQFRRAVWLNPYENRFKEHLAVCLHRQGKTQEAAEWAAQVPPEQRCAELQELTPPENGSTDEKGSR
jgi:tetratricopeptide (TPR) repeat protein